MDLQDFATSLAKVDQALRDARCLLGHLQQQCDEAQAELITLHLDHKEATHALQYQAMRHYVKGGNCNPHPAILINPEQSPGPAAVLNNLGMLLAEKEATDGPTVWPHH